MNRKVEWDARITLGNVLTIFIMALGGAGAFVRMEVGDAQRDERIASIEKRVTALEVSGVASTNRLASVLEHINTRLSKIEGYLSRDGRSPR